MVAGSAHCPAARDHAAAEERLLWIEQHDPHYPELQTRLAAVRQYLSFETSKQVGDWQAVIDGWPAFVAAVPNAPDPSSVRPWAEQQQELSQLQDRALDAADQHHWDVVVETLIQLHRRGGATKETVQLQEWAVRMAPHYQKERADRLAAAAASIDVSALEKLLTEYPGYDDAYWTRPGGAWDREALMQWAQQRAHARLAPRPRARPSDGTTIAASAWSQRAAMRQPRRSCIYTYRWFIIVILIVVSSS